MPFNLAAIPRGLMDLLATRSMGEMPRAIDELVKLTVDGTEFYLSSKLETIAGNGTAPIVGFNTVLTVPPNEMWIVMQVSGNVVGADAGVSAVMGLAISPPGGSILIGPTGAVPAVARTDQCSNPLRIAIPAGMRLGLFLQSIAGGAYTGATTTGVTALAYRLRAGG